MLQCVPPFLSQKMVEHLMKNYIKAFVATGIGMAMMKMVAEPDFDQVIFIFLLGILENNTKLLQADGIKVSTPALMSSLMSSVTSEDEKQWKIILNS